MRKVCRLHVRGVETLPAGGCLVVPNHLGWKRALILHTACHRPIRFLVYEPVYRKLLLNPVFRLLGAIPVPSRKPQDILRAASACLHAGEMVCLFPEGELARPGMLLRLRRDYERIAHAAECPVVPVWLGRLCGPVFAWQEGQFPLPHPMSVHFGEPMEHHRAGIALLRQRMLELGERLIKRAPSSKATWPSLACGG